MTRSAASESVDQGILANGLFLGMTNAAIWPPAPRIAGSRAGLPNRSRPGDPPDRRSNRACLLGPGRVLAIRAIQSPGHGRPGPLLRLHTSGQPVSEHRLSLKEAEIDVVEDSAVEDSARCEVETSLMASGIGKTLYQSRERSSAPTCATRLDRPGSPVWRAQGGGGAVATGPASSVFSRARSDIRRARRLYKEEHHA